MSDVNPLAPLSDDALVAAHMQQGANSYHLTEMLRRHKVESAVLGRRIWWLNLLLLIFTVAICLLTVVLVWTALREAGSARSQSTEATPSVSAGPAWVLWHNTETVSRVNADGGLTYTWTLHSWDPKGAHPARKDCIEALSLFSKEWPEKPKVGDQRSTYRCLPDTVDPRGPKGK